MSMEQKLEQLDLNALLQEVNQEVDALIKHEKEKLDALQKSEESKKEESSSSSSDSKAGMEKKEESSMSKAEESSSSSSSSKAEEMKKDDGSGFESPAPEASSDQSMDSQQQSMGDESAESLESMVQSLDDEMLQELMQVVQMEMEARKSKDQAPAAPEQQAPAPEEQGLEMAYKTEVDGLKEKLTKSEEQTKQLEKAIGDMTDLLDKVINRPVIKAVTDIRNVEYVDKGEKELAKSEAKDVSDADLSKRLREMAGNPKELAKLTKSERENLSGFFVNKKRTPEVLKLISK